MDDQHALRILNALANGTDPNTGEIYPPESPYQSPDVIRALFVATRAIDERGARNVSPQNSASRAGAAQRQQQGGNIGKTWSADEDRQLLASFDAGKSLAELAQHHGRTQGGVRARLEKHGRLEPSPATRWPVSNSSNRNGQSQNASTARSNQ